MIASEPVEEPTGPPASLFEMIDSDRSGKVQMMEMFSAYMVMDTNNDGKVSPEEFVAYLLDNSLTICESYQERIADLL